MINPFRERAEQIEQKAIAVIELGEQIFLLERQLQELADKHFLAVAAELEQAGCYSDLLCQTRARVRTGSAAEYQRLQGELDDVKKRFALLDAELQKMKALFNLDEYELAEQRHRLHQKNWN